MRRRREKKSGLRFFSSNFSIALSVTCASGCCCCSSVLVVVPCFGTGSGGAAAVGVFPFFSAGFGGDVCAGRFVVVIVSSSLVKSVATKSPIDSSDVAIIT